jgi:hypothetical protein
MKTRRYRVEYRDQGSSQPVFSMAVNAYDATDAEDRFWELGGGEGWEVVSVQPEPRLR